MIKKFESYIKEKNELIGKRIRLIQMGNDPDPIEPGTEGTIDHVDGIGQIHVKWDNGRTLAIVPEEDKYEIITEDASTVATVGSGTAVGGGAVGSFTSSAGVAVYGGDSGTAFATNSNTSGMGDIVSAQPSSIPGDVAGSTKGSGDLGSQTLGTFTKEAARKKKKKKKKDKRKRKYNKTGSNIDNFYVTKYTEKANHGGKMIMNWETFNEDNNFLKFSYKGNDLPTQDMITWVDEYYNSEYDSTDEIEMKFFEYFHDELMDLSYMEMIDVFNNSKK